MRRDGEMRYYVKFLGLWVRVPREWWNGRFWYWPRMSRKVLHD